MLSEIFQSHMGYTSIELSSVYIWTKSIPLTH
nr:MAG TPA: hypothetical protein [Caudoviricetes sp.]